MGVRGLLGSIRPYSTRTVWKKDQSSTSGVVIDGPALVFYIYHHCVACQRRARNALFAVPSYNLICQATLMFLEKLESTGLPVKHIFFDGALPASKFATRLERMQKSVNDMRGFKNLHPSPLEYPRQVVDVTAEDVWSSISGQAVYVSDRVKSLHAAPFIIPAVKEYLQASRYASIIQLVPGEADIYCTSANSCEVHDVILTSDSDFILQNPAAKVCFFSNLEFTEGDLILQTYDCQDIARRLKVPDGQMALLGYHMHLDPYIGLLSCADRAQLNSQENDNGYLEFRQQYHPWALERKWGATAESWQEDIGRDRIVDLTLLIQRLDPRVTELIVDAGYNRRFNLFLPALFEDPARSSAWSLSAHIRHMAFSVVSKKFKKTEHNYVDFHEFDRSGISVKDKIRSIATEDEDHWRQRLYELCDRIDSLLTTFRDRKANHIWAALTLLVFLDEANNNSMLPDRKDVARLLCDGQSARAKTLSWLQIHLNAQVEACFYSLRMLKQLASLASVIAPEDEQLKRMVELFQTMPPLYQILRPPILGMDFGGPNDRINLEVGHFYPDFDANRDAQVERPATKSKRKKQKGEAPSAQKSSQRSIGDSRNIFDVLRDGM